MTPVRTFPFGDALFEGTLHLCLLLAIFDIVGFIGAITARGRILLLRISCGGGRILIISRRLGVLAVVIHCIGLVPAVTILRGIATAEPTVKLENHLPNKVEIIQMAKGFRDAHLNVTPDGEAIQKDPCPEARHASDAHGDVSSMQLVNIGNPVSMTPVPLPCSGNLCFMMVHVQILHAFYQTIKPLARKVCGPSSPSAQSLLSVAVGNVLRRIATSFRSYGIFPRHSKGSWTLKPHSRRKG